MIASSVRWVGGTVPWRSRLRKKQPKCNSLIRKKKKSWLIEAGSKDAAHPRTEQATAALVGAGSLWPNCDSICVHCELGWPSTTLVLSPSWVRPVKRYIHPENVAFAARTLIASTDHIPMMFKTAPETWGKNPIWEKKEQRETTQVQVKGAEPKVHHEGVLEHIMFQSPHHRKKHIRKRKEWCYLFV